MSNLGAYQWMTTAAKEAGGVEAWLEMVKRAAYNSGAKDMKNKMFAPLILGGIGLGALGMGAYQKVKAYRFNKKEERELAERAARAEELLRARLESEMNEKEDTI